MELLGTTTILLLICISCLLLFATQRSTSHKGKEPPGPMTFPIVGNILHLNPRNVPESLKKLSEKYGPVFTIYLGPKKVVVLYGYDVVKEALIDQADDFSGRGTLPLITKLFRGTGIVTSNGETWKQLRRFALTTLRDFGMGKKSIEERIQEEAHFLVERIKNTHRQPFNPGRFLLHAVSNIICSIVFGDRFDYEDKKFLTLIDLIEENNNLQLSVQAQEKGNSHSEFNTETLTRTTLDLFLAGTGTTSVTLRHGFLILHKYPEIVEKIQQEIDSVIGRDRSPRMADRSRMPYTDAVIHEIQRYIDFIPLNVPHAVIKDTKFRDYFIPKDTMIFPMLSSVLHDSKEFPNPEKFDPGHFLNANGTFKKSDYFMPFSAGKRICAGEGLARMEIFIFVTSILQNFTLKPVVDLKDIDTTPLISSLASMPRHYEISFVPR
ncbi:PREDICTED: cytochrome P450 2H1-like isoform X2 [Acanthisitta chloris]|uniref:cytochrome P450 2H1-like isoform X2 n=1 Tax=Acanthisitta chloris TaxID=57068 RepID=UPI0004F0F313|nr:PREDICTED: cytochrome P450 2H1-like isoform X2 [Acanthisitta chloris]